MTSERSPTNHEAGQRLQCMEVWGGNHAANSGVAMPGLDAWVYAQPYESGAGGDVHLVSNCATGRIIRLLVADVSGHGAGVADIADQLRQLMRRHSNYLDQSKFVAELNREFAKITTRGGFATSVAATYWAPTGVLVICNAGHPRPLWHRAKDRQWQFLSDEDLLDGDQLSNLPLGIVAPTTYIQFGVRLHHDDLVLIYTDSLTEAQCPNGKLLGEEGLLELVSGLDPTHSENLIASLLKKLVAYRGGAPPTDDVTVLLLRHNGAMVKLTMRDRIAAMGRMMKMLISSLLPGRPAVAWPELRMETIGGMFFNRLNRHWGRK